MVGVMKKRYSKEDRVIAFTMYRNKSLEIGFFDIKRIAEITGHSTDSYKMKIDQFKGINGPRKRIYKDGDIGPGLNEWAKEDEDVVNEFKNTDIKLLNILAKNILDNKFRTWRNMKWEKYYKEV